MRINQRVSEMCMREGIEMPTEATFITISSFSHGDFTL